MELVFITHHSLLGFGVLPPVLTYLVLAGALYGAARGLWDGFGWVGDRLETLGRRIRGEQKIETSRKDPSGP